MRGGVRGVGREGDVEMERVKGERKRRPMIHGLGPESGSKLFSGRGGLDWR